MVSQALSSLCVTAGSSPSPAAGKYRAQGRMWPGGEAGASHLMLSAGEGRSAELQSLALF